MFISSNNQLTVVNDVDIQTPTSNNYVKKVDVANSTLIVGDVIMLDNTGG